LVRAAGSYPAGRWFESDRRYQARPHGQEVKTSPFHGGNRSSNLLGVTKREHSSAGRALALQARCHRFEPYCSHQSHQKKVAFFICKRKQRAKQLTLIIRISKSQFFCSKKVWYCVWLKSMLLYIYKIS
jgi:hypothetical protein